MTGFRPLLAGKKKIDTNCIVIRNNLLSLTSKFVGNKQPQTPSRY